MKKKFFDNDLEIKCSYVYKVRVARDRNYWGGLMNAQRTSGFHKPWS